MRGVGGRCTGNRRTSGGVADEFLNAMDRNLAQNDPPSRSYSRRVKNSLWGGGEYPHLLWALELLAWSPDYLARVTDILAKLTQLDPDGRYQNRPRNTFQQIYRLWYPQTSATLDQRNVVLKRLRKSYPRDLVGAPAKSVPKEP